MITRTEVFQSTDALNNMAGRFREAHDRSFEFVVLVALRIIIHLLMGNLESAQAEKGTEG